MANRLISAAAHFLFYYYRDEVTAALRTLGCFAANCADQDASSARNKSISRHLAFLWSTSRLFVRSIRELLLEYNYWEFGLKLPRSLHRLVEIFVAQQILQPFSLD